MTEKALDYDVYINSILERLQGLEKIHKESPNISNSFDLV